MSHIVSMILVMLVFFVPFATADQNLCQLSFEKKNYELASEECGRIAQFDPFAQYVLGEISLEKAGHLSPAAMKWFLRAAENGGIDAQRKLGELSSSGSFGQKNYKQARFWFEKAAEQGDSESQMSLGNLLLTGRGGKKNAVAGLMWLELSAKQGHQDARNMAVEVKKALSQKQKNEVNGLVADWPSTHPKLDDVKSDIKGAM